MYLHNFQAGNVVTGEMVEQLILCGADIVKVGIGPGTCNLYHAMTSVLLIRDVGTWGTCPSQDFAINKEVPFLFSGTAP